MLLVGSKALLSKCISCSTVQGGTVDTSFVFTALHAQVRPNRFVTFQQRGFVAQRPLRCAPRRRFLAKTFEEEGLRMLSMMFDIVASRVFAPPC